MDHAKIVASAFTLSIALALLLLGTDRAAAGNNLPNRWDSQLVSTVGRGEGSHGGNEQTVKPPIQPSGSISAKPSVTVTLGAWRNLRPTESTLNGVSLLPSSYSVNCQDPDQKSQGWAVGDSGVILGYCNGVWDHAIVPQYDLVDLFGVQAISPTLAVAVGDQGAIQLYQFEVTQGDWEWVKLPVPQVNKRLNSVSLVKRDDGSYFGWTVGYADANLGNRGTLVQGVIDAPSGSPNPSSHWTNVTASYSLPVVTAYYAVHTLTPTNAWAVGGTSSTGSIVHWDGTQWSLFQSVPDPLYGIRLRSASEGWAVGKAGAIYRYNGSTWTKVSSPTTQILAAVGYAPNGEQLIVGYGNALLKYVNGNWQQFPPENLRTDPFDFRAVDFTSGHGWLVGGHFSRGIGGQILEYENGLWLAVTPPTDNRLNAIATVSDNDAWAVGDYDNSGGTIIHWDGRHWQRWYQQDLPIPTADLYTISMVSATDGWAAGDPSSGLAVLLHWDGKRWAKPRYNWPVTARINGLDAFKTSDPNYPVFAWAVADTGDAFAKYQTRDPDYWVSLSSCYGNWYQMFGVTIIPGFSPPGNWDAWAVGRRRSNIAPFTPGKAGFAKFKNDACGKNAWDWYQDAPGDANTSRLYGIKMIAGGLGYAVGNQSDQARIYSYNSGTGVWGATFTQSNGSMNPSNLYSADIITSSQVAWFGGFYSNPNMGNKKWAYIDYIDSTGPHWVDPTYILPRNGINVNHRPLRGIDMASDTMGWAVGDPEDTSAAEGKSVILQYPFPNFTLDAHPPARVVLPTASTAFTVTVNAIGGFSTNVSLSFPGGFPTGVYATVDPTSIGANQVATVSVTTTDTPVGFYCLVLRGSATFMSGDVSIPVSRDVCLNLYVSTNAVYGVSPDHGPAGTTVTISGDSFGSDPGVGNRSTASNHVSWGGVQLPDSAVLSWSNNQITFQPPDTPGLFTDFPLIGRVQVTSNGSASNDNYTFKMDPWITSIAAVTGTDLIAVTLTGTSFGNDPGINLRNTELEHIALDGSRVEYWNVISWSNNSIVFAVPLGTRGGAVMVTTNGFDSNIVSFGTPADKVFLPYIKK